MKWKDLLRYSLLSLVLVQGCKPENVGFLNDNLRYNVAELQVVQGTSMATPAIVANGSSTPMNVELLQIRNKATGAVVPEFLVPHSYNVYTGEVGVDVTTMDQLAELIAETTSPSISVTEIGGRVVLTPATENVQPGLYTIDLNVKNIAGSNVYNEALDINLIPMVADSIFAKSGNTTPLLSESGAVNLTASQYSTTVEYREDEQDKIIFMWLDKNGVPFNPKEDEIIKRATLPSFADWSPFYPEELTDTAIVYPYPYYKGIYYPVKRTVRVGTTNYTNLACNYRVVGDFTDIGRNVNTSTTVRFYKPGTHIVRFHLNSVVKTMPREVTITKNVTLPEGAGYTATPVAIDMDELAELFGIPAADIAGKLGSTLTYFAIEPDGTRNPNSTAGAPGHWFAADGKTVGWGSTASLFSEMRLGNAVFNIGQYPGNNFSGDTFTIKQMIMYNGGQGITRVFFVFNITIQ